jgi:hypothetical protein
MEFKTHYVDLATIIPPAGTKGSAFLLVYCEHDGGAGTDTYTNNKGFGTPQATIALVGLDCHMKKIRIGSPTPAPI